MSLLTNLVSYWALNEASGNALDSHSTNDLTDNNTVGSATGKVGNARDFEADNLELFTKADNADLSTGDIDFHLSGWVQFESQTSTRMIVMKGNDLNGTYEYCVFNFGGSLFFRVESGAASVDVGSSSLANGTWYKFDAWHDSVNNQIGISLNNGTPVTASYSGGVTDNAQAFQIGNDSSLGRPHDGLIDEVGFWKRVLTSDERTDLYNAGNGLSYDDFDGGGDPGPGSIAVDSSHSPGGGVAYSGGGGLSF